MTAGHCEEPDRATQQSLSTKAKLLRLWLAMTLQLKELQILMKPLLVSFMDYDLGYFDEDSKKLEPLGYPFVPEIV